MEANPYRWQPAPAGADTWDYEAGAERFPQRLEAALRTTLKLFDDEPELGLLLTGPPSAADELATRRHEHWQERFADLLRAAAERSPSAYVHPPFMEPTLIAGIRWRISSRLLADDDAGRLENLLPGLLEFVLVCYFGPKDAAPSLAFRL
jgi:hypothetical protein